jgi:hypothetical protein
MVSRDEFERATDRAALRQKKEPLIIAASYDRGRGKIMISLDIGIDLALHPGLAEGLRGASANDLSEIEITPSGLGLHWPRLDADLYLPGLLHGIYGSKKWMAKQLGSEGGKVRSVAKASAARENGRKGGRPRKATTEAKCA